jgi:transposase
VGRGIWEELNHTLRDQVREKLGRSTQPSALAKLAVGIAYSGIQKKQIAIIQTEIGVSQ